MGYCFQGIRRFVRSGHFAYNSRRHFDNFQAPDTHKEMEKDMVEQKHSDGIYLSRDIRRILEGIGACIPLTPAIRRNERDVALLWLAFHTALYAVSKVCGCSDIYPMSPQKMLNNPQLFDIDGMLKDDNDRD